MTRHDNAQFPREAPVHGRFSVVTVCYNAEPHIAECIRSVRAQDHPDVEHIIVDGASTDATLKIVEAEASPGARMFSEPDDGLYDAMNKGIRAASGEYIAILNADDRYADEGILSRAARTFEQAKVDAVLGDVSYFKFDQPDRVTRRYRSSRFRPERIARGVMPAHPAMMLTSDAYMRIGAYRTDYRIASDYEFVLRAFLLGGLSYFYVPEVFVKMTAGGLSNRGLASARVVTEEMLRACREHGVSTTRWRLWSRIPGKMLEMVFPR